jgi:hypothetical protein
MSSRPLIFGIFTIQPSSRYKCPSSGIFALQKLSSHEYITNQDKKTRIIDCGKGCGECKFRLCNIHSVRLPLLFPCIFFIIEGEKPRCEFQMVKRSRDHTKNPSF